MEYAKNGNLFGFVRRNPELPEARLRDFFAQTASGIQYIHSCGIVHRDIKPENILLDEELNVKICDFGWSTALQGSAVRKTFCGTYEYMAPEIFESSAYDFTVDIWSLGILLFELLHGFSPFRGKGIFEIYRNIVTNRIPFKESLDPQARALITMILQRAPTKRPTVQAILAHPYLQPPKPFCSPKPSKSDLALNLAAITGAKSRSRSKAGLMSARNTELDTIQKQMPLPAFVKSNKLQKEKENSSASQCVSARMRSKPIILPRPAEVSKDSFKQLLKSLKSDLIRIRRQQSPQTDRRRLKSRDNLLSIVPQSQRSLSNNVLKYVSPGFRVNRAPSSALSTTVKSEKFAFNFKTENSVIGAGKSDGDWSAVEAADTVKKRPKAAAERLKSLETSHHKPSVAKQLFAKNRPVKLEFDGPYFSRP